MKMHQGVLPFKLVVSDDDRANVTAHAGLILVVEALRAVLSNKVYRRLRRSLGYKKWHVVRRHVESLVLLFVAGGDHVDDIAVLRADVGLARLLGFVPSSATQLKDFLYRFHQAREGRMLSKKEDAELSHKGEAHIREEGPGLRLLRWQREKQGTVEHGHCVLKSELAGGTMPCGRFGSNAAWWRLNVLAHNLQQLIKVRSLSAEMQPLRPKALRFRLFNIVGRIIEHSRRLVLLISRAHPWAEEYVRARQSMLDLKRQARVKPATPC